MFKFGFWVRAASAVWLGSLLAANAQPKVEFVERPGSIDVLAGGQLLTTYRYDDPLTKPVLYPVRTLSGVPINRAYPLEKIEGETRDHPHHIGLFFTYDEVNKIGFWNTTNRPPQIKHIETKEMKGGSGSGRLATVLQWLDLKDQPVLEEQRSMTFTARENEYWIDFNIRLAALDKTVEFEDTKEGMFALRVAEWLKEEAPGTGHYTNSEGAQSEKGVWGKRARWVTLQGEHDGKTIGVAIFHHPASVNYPTFWHARGYGLFAANPLGQEAFQKGLKEKDPKPFHLTLKPGESALFGFRVLVYEGTRDSAQLEKQFADFSQEAMGTAKVSVVAPGAKLEKLSSIFAFTEGASVDKDGNVFFTDQPNDKIYKWSTDAKLSVFLDACERANGTYFEKNGNLLACADLYNRLVSIDPQGKMTVLVDKYQDHLLNGPNDVWLHPETGAIYFTDPYYRRDYWKRGPMEQDGQHVYRVSPDRKSVVRVINDLVQPNGIVGTPDGKILYVADIGAGKTYSYAISPDGSLADKRLFCSLGSDGMTLDAEGNVYLTGRGVTVFDSQGAKIDHIDVPEGWSANVCFGGVDRQTLFITAQRCLYSIRMRTRGVE
jgi:gluconolactonase